MDQWTHQLKKGTLKVRVFFFDGWTIEAIRSDTNEVDKFPIMYFKENFEVIKTILH